MAVLLISALTPALADHIRKPELTRAYEKLDVVDTYLAERTAQRTLERAPSKTTRRWSSSISGMSGAVTPLRSFKARGGYFCREFSESIFTGNGVAMTHVAIACRDRDGIWKVAGR